MANKGFKKVLTVGALVLGMALTAPLSAQAVAWGTLSVAEGGTYRGYSAGNATLVSSAYLNNSYWYSCTVAVGCAVDTRWSFYKTISQMPTTPQWFAAGSTASPTYNSLSRKNYTVQKSLDPVGTQGRVTSLVCIPKPWGVPWTCSNPAINTFSY